MTNKTNSRDWDKIVQDVIDEIPEVDSINWAALFKEDPVILGELVNDIIKLGVSEKGRPGKRSASSMEEIAEDLKKLTGEDYTVESAQKALNRLMLKKGKSLQGVANGSGFSKQTIHRLSSGETSFRVEHLIGVAKAFKKHPSFFKEYRIAYICSALGKLIEITDDSSIIIFEKLRGQAGSS
jgi:transcriptional regulator with XRE-family HTH domain